MKKITSMFMAVAMILALAVPALAGSTASATITGSAYTGSAVDPNNPYNSDFLGEYQDTVINISLPNNVALVFNPYRLQYDASAHSSEGDAYLVDQLADQIFSAPVTIVSKSNIQLDVDIQFTKVEAEGGLKLKETQSDYDDADYDKNVLLKMEYGIVDTADASPSDLTGDAKKTVILSKATTLTALQEEDKTQTLTARIPAGDASHPKYFGYKFTGQASTETSNTAEGAAPNPYTDQDKINVGLAFRFIPVANDPDQIQGGKFYYNISTDTTPVASDRTTPTATKSDPITVDLLKAVNAKGTGNRTYTYADNTFAQYQDNSTDTDGITVDNTGKKLIIAKELLLKNTQYMDTTKTKDTKYVVVVPVNFTVTNGESGDNLKTDPVKCNVRIIMCPLEAAS